MRFKAASASSGDNLPEFRNEPASLVIRFMQVSSTSGFTS